MMPLINSAEVEEARLGRRSIKKLAVFFKRKNNLFKEDDLPGFVANEFVCDWHK